MATQPVLESEGIDERQTPLLEGPSVSTRDPKMRRLLMVRADDLSPLPGMRAYAGAELLAGPSGPSGWLEFAPLAGRRTTFWAEGWVPREFRTQALPLERVLLSAADASLEVQLDSLDPAEGALRCQLEPVDWTANTRTAWSRSPEILTPSRLVGQTLAPGRYQLYVWVGAFGEAGTPLEPVTVELVSGQRAFVRLDASLKPDEEVDS